MTESVFTYEVHNVQFDQIFKDDLAVYNLDGSIKEVQGFKAILCLGLELRKYVQINFPVHFPKQSCFGTLKFLICRR